MNASAVTNQVNHIKSRPNLLAWYTADEPDGPFDPLDATLKASDLITSSDGGDGKGGAGYHPISLVLNCENYYFTYVSCFSTIVTPIDAGLLTLLSVRIESNYTSGTDIVMQGAYTIGNNVTFSSAYQTVCNKDFGDCGLVP